MMRTLFEKLWDAHLVEMLEGGRGILLIDRVMLHEITGGFALRDLQKSGEKPRMAAAHIFAVADHAISTAIDRQLFDSPSPNGPALIRSLADAAQSFGIRYAAPDSPEHGIVHVIAPEQGLIEPGQTLVCGDSHTCTLGAFGSLCFAVGASDIGMVLKHNALIVKKPKTMRVELHGQLQPFVTAKDVMLSLISRFGSDVANGYVIEFTGDLVQSLGIEARLTLCNMAAEMGTRYAMIAPDVTLLTYIAAQRKVKIEDLPENLLARWAALQSDAGAVFDRTLEHDAGAIEPQVTWGTSPSHAIAVTGKVPGFHTALNGTVEEGAFDRALNYMQVQPDMPLQSIAIDAAFIGSCTNARLSDLREAAKILKGHHVADGVRAMCTPGSAAVRRAAEAEGIDRIFIEAGFEWRMPGCSNCAGREGPIWANKRVISSTNRNFENRQGPQTRTHIASPATVAASSIAGYIADPRTIRRLP